MAASTDSQKPQKWGSWWDSGRKLCEKLLHSVYFKPNSSMLCIYFTETMSVFSLQK